MLKYFYYTYRSFVFLPTSLPSCRNASHFARGKAPQLPPRKAVLGEEKGEVGRLTANERRRFGKLFFGRRAALGFNAKRQVIRDISTTGKSSGAKRRRQQSVTRSLAGQGTPHSPGAYLPPPAPGTLAARPPSCNAPVYFRRLRVINGSAPRVATILCRTCCLDVIIVRARTHTRANFRCILLLANSLRAALAGASYELRPARRDEFSNVRARRPRIASYVRTRRITAVKRRTRIIVARDLRRLGQSLTFDISMKFLGELHTRLLRCDYACYVVKSRAKLPRPRAILISGLRDRRNGEIT